MRYLKCITGPMHERTVMEKREKYESLLVEVNALIQGEKNTVGVLGNVCALIKEKMSFFWVGFYLVDKNASGVKELKLGPFQGPVACYRIGYGKGVCGKAWEEEKTLVVKDVEEFPGHIACSSLSRSEIVVPVRGCGGNYESGDVVAVLDIDSESVATFDEVDAEYLEKLCSIVSDELF